LSYTVSKLVHFWDTVYIKKLIVLVTCVVKTCLCRAEIVLIPDDLRGSEWNSFAWTRTSCWGPLTTSLMRRGSFLGAWIAPPAQAPQHVTTPLPLTKLPHPMIPTADHDNDRNRDQKENAGNEQREFLYTYTRINITVTVYNKYRYTGIHDQVTTATCSSPR